MFKKMQKYVLDKKQARHLVILTTLYFIVEIIVNFSIYRQLSISNDRFTAETMEFWGKGIAGVGLALICTRYLLVYSKKRHHTYYAFLCACLFAVPLSFLLQTVLIYYVTETSTDQDRNKAVLITATHSTLVPFFGINHWTKRFEISVTDKLMYPFLKPIAHVISTKHGVYKKSLLDSLAVTKPCALTIADATGTTKGFDKAFFPYLSLIKNVDESKYKQMIKDYHLCANKNEAYFKEYSMGTVNHKLLLVDMYHQKFAPMVEKYNGYKDYENNLEEAKKEADKQWRKAMDDSFGFKTTIKPKSMDYFYNHADVRRVYEEKTGIKDLYPQDKDFKEKSLKLVNESLPNSAIPAYLDKTGEPSEQYKKLTADEIADQGKKSYKAIVMPIIAMALSAFFLIMNFTIATQSYLSRFLDGLWGRFYSAFLKDRTWKLLAAFATHKRLKMVCKKLRVDDSKGGLFVVNCVARSSFWLPQLLIRKAFLILAFLWFIVLPLTLSGGVYDELDNANYKHVMKILYFNESTLIKGYDLLIAPVNSATTYFVEYVEASKEKQKVQRQLEDIREMESMSENSGNGFDY